MNNVFQFGSGYRMFCWPWFRHWLRPRTYYKPFVRAYQRVTRGWADCDVWSIDSHLSNIIPPMVRHLQKTSHGYPGDMFGEDEEEKVANWNAILEAIAVGFEAVQKMDDMPDRFFTELETSTGWHKDFGMKDREYYWDGYRAYQADQEQILANGFYLFQHRFRSLWD